MPHQEFTPHCKCSHASVAWMDQVVVFPDGSVTWIPIESESAASEITEAAQTPDPRSAQQVDVHLYHHFPKTNRAMELLTAGMAIAALALPIWYFMPIWAQALPLGAAPCSSSFSAK